MTPEALTAAGKARHPGGPWITPFAKEIAFSRSTVWKAATGRIPVSRDLANAVKLLPKRKPKHQPRGEEL